MAKNSVNIAVIGFGYWGPNMVRNFNALPNVTVRCICDFNEERLEVAQQLYPEVIKKTSPREVISDPKTDAVIVATPLYTHYELAKKALSAGKHVLIEKPMTTNSIEAEELINLAEKNGLTIMIDHTYLYSGAIQKIKTMVDTTAIGKIQYIDSTRINLGLFNAHANVLWDLAPHDISIVNYLMNDEPYSVQATGVSHTNNGIENIAYLTMNYQSNMIAHFNCSWASPVKIRKLLIGGDKKMILFDDMEVSNKIRVYDSGYELTQSHNNEAVNTLQVDYRVGDVEIPKFSGKEALAAVAEDFISAILLKTTPIADTISGINVIKVLEASQESIKNGGKEVKVNYL